MTKYVRIVFHAASVKSYKWMSLVGREDMTFVVLFIAFPALLESRKEN